MSCVLCKVTLSDEELSFYRSKYAAIPGMQNVKKSQITGETLAAHYVLACKKHWCSCMKENGTSPWNWLNYCSMKSCGNVICKSCQSFVPKMPSETYCPQCFWKTLNNAVLLA